MQNRQNLERLVIFTRKCKFSHDGLVFCKKEYCLVESGLKKCKDPVSLMFQALAYGQIQASPEDCRHAITPFDFPNPPGYIGVF